MTKKIYLFLFCLVSFFTSYAQEFNGKNVRWHLPENTDKRFKAFFGSTGFSFGSESTSLAVENLTQNKLILKFKVTCYDLCGDYTIKSITRSVNPLGKAGTSPFFDGSEYSTKCTVKKKYSDSFSSKLGKVEIELVSVQEIPGNNVAGTTPTKKENNPSPVSSNVCNVGLPQVLISEAGEYYVKISDGSYQKITKEIYLTYKSKPTQKEKERYIQDCTGNGLIRLDAKPVY